MGAEVLSVEVGHRGVGYCKGTGKIASNRKQAAGQWAVGSGLPSLEFIPSKPEPDGDKVLGVVGGDGHPPLQPHRRQPSPPSQIIGSTGVRCPHG